MKHEELFKQTAQQKSAKSWLGTLLLLLIAMLLPQGAWAANHYDAGYGSWTSTHDADGVKFKITALRMYNYNGNNSQFRSNPEVNVVAEGKTHTFYLGSLTGNTGKDTFYYNGEGNENPYKGSGSFSKVTYDQTQNDIRVKAYFNNQKNDQKVTTNPDKNYKDNGNGSDKWCTADLTIEIYAHTCTKVTIAGNWGDYSDGINKTESYSWTFNLGHSLTNVQTTPATCAETGLRKSTCSCGAVTEEVLPKDPNAHNYDKDGLCTNQLMDYQAPEGQGTKDSPYLVKNIGNLYWLSDQVYIYKRETFHARQVCDITASDSYDYAVSIGCRQGNSVYTFRGTYDGGGYVIKNLKSRDYWVRSDYEEGLLFGRIEGATIKNVGIVGAEYKEIWDQIPKHFGVLCGYAKNSTISNCFVLNTDYQIEATYGSAAICGYCDASTITNCYTNDEKAMIAEIGSKSTLTGCYGRYRGITNTAYTRSSIIDYHVISANDVSSGALCYTMNGEQTNGTQTWYQKLGTNAEVYPTPKKDVSKTVYKIANLKCDGKTANGSYTYTNDKNAKFVDAHNFASSFTTDKEVTCVQEGSKSKHCSVCDAKTEVTTISALNHSMIEHAAKLATCSEDGNLLYYTCSRACCSGKYYKDCGAHTANAYANQAATGTSMLSHIMAEHAANPATCTEDGNLLYYTCSQACCSDKYYKDGDIHTTDAYADFDATVIAALDHDYQQIADEDYFVSAATCGDDAKYHEKCSRCTFHGEEWAVTGTATGLHTFANNNADNGVCTVCNHGFFRYVADELIDPSTPASLQDEYDNTLQILSHTFSDGKGVMEFNAPLVTIGYRAFQSCFYEQVTIPITVKAIGSWAFENCVYLERLNVPNSVETIGSYAFMNCSGLRTVFLGKSVREIGGDAFAQVGDPDIYLKSLPQFTGDDDGFLSAFHNTSDIEDEEGVMRYEHTPIPVIFNFEDDSYVSSGHVMFNDYVRWANYTRKGISEEWGTLALPFPIGRSDTDDYTLYKFVNKKNGDFYFEPVREWEPIFCGTPVIYHINPELLTDGQKFDLHITSAFGLINTKLDIIATPEPEEEMEEGYLLAGTYSDEMVVDHNDYFFEGDKLYWTQNYLEEHNLPEIKVAPFSAYMKDYNKGPKPTSYTCSGEESNLDLQYLDFNENNYIDEKDIAGNDFGIRSEILLLGEDGRFNVADIIKVLKNLGKEFYSRVVWKASDH